MPPTRARVDDWTQLPIPQTPLQRGAFIDACARWLIAPPATASEETVLDPPTDYAGRGGDHATRPVCAACGGASPTRCVVNSFAQCHRLPLCDACATCTA